MKLFPAEIIKYNLANLMGRIICENLTQIFNAFFFFEIMEEEGDNYFSSSYIKMEKQVLTLSQTGMTWHLVNNIEYSRDT